MEIVSASNSVVVLDMGITYLNYTFSSDYERYADLKANIDTLKEFMDGHEHVPSVYDAVLREKDGVEYLSLTVQKPQFQPLSKYEQEISVEGAEAIMKTVLEVVQSARERDIYHLDIGMHNICYDDSLFEVQVIDWYDSVLSTPSDPPLFMNLIVPPEVEEWELPITKEQLQLAENYQICCFFVDVIEQSELSIEPPQALRHGCSGAVDERPTLETIQNEVNSLFN